MFKIDKVTEIFKRVVGRDPDRNDYPAIVGISKMDGMTEASIASFFAPLAAAKVANEFPVLAPPEPIPVPVALPMPTPVVVAPVAPAVPPTPKPVVLAPTVEPVAKPTPAPAPAPVPKPFYKPVAKETPKPTPVDLPRRPGADARTSQFNFEDDNTPINGTIPPKVERIEKKAHKGKKK